VRGYFIITCKLPVSCFDRKIEKNVYHICAHIFSFDKPIEKKAHHICAHIFSFDRQIERKSHHIIVRIFSVLARKYGKRSITCEMVITVLQIID
jgi:hypothetical protein